jgi:flavin reductase (DIM6/NTAB) family NADH-FMN oxidoreductase RutF
VSVGDHDLFIGRVDALANSEEHPSPLLYFRRRYLRVEKARAVVPQGRPQ